MEPEVDHLTLRNACLGASIKDPEAKLMRGYNSCRGR